jgi:ribosomal protein L37E
MAETQRDHPTETLVSIVCSGFVQWTWHARVPILARKFFILKGFPRKLVAPGCGKHQGTESEIRRCGGRAAEATLGECASLGSATTRKMSVLGIDLSQIEYPTTG